VRLQLRDDGDREKQYEQSNVLGAALTDSGVHEMASRGSVLENVRVLEVGDFAFVPAAGALLSDWGANVIKIEHTKRPDSMRGMVTASLLGIQGAKANFLFDTVNRGKKSVAIDISTDSGKRLILRLAENADVFLTNIRPSARRKLGIDVEDIMAVNPEIVYAKGSGFGANGPDNEKAGYDTTAFWANSGVAYMLSEQVGKMPMHPPGYGDVTSGMFLAGGIAAALVRKFRTGQGGVVDASLLSSGLWSMGFAIAGAEAIGEHTIPIYNHAKSFNPLVAAYKCKDGRYIQFVLSYHDKGWIEFCEVLAHPELLGDPRFQTGRARIDNTEALVSLLDEYFFERTSDEWMERLSDFDGAWALVQAPGDLSQTHQVKENQFVQDVPAEDGSTVRLVSSPIQFDGATPVIARTGPEHGQHTEEVLLDAGFSWDEILALKDEEAII
jgi:crotonobetainyl-CoA:carnitine CoA-transferase CaiB-like acyl-CoA transferase